MLVIITGASKGIGFETVKLFLNNPKYSIIAVSRTTDSLNKLAEKENTINLIPVKADITNATHVKKIISIIKKINMPVAILIIPGPSGCLDTCFDYSIVDYSIFDC